MIPEQPNASLSGAAYALWAIEIGQHGDEWCKYTTALVFKADRAWPPLAAALAKGSR